MKKMFISVIALAMGVTAMATETAYVQIKLTGETGGASNVFLTEDDAYTNAFEPGADVEKMMSQANSKSVLMYGFVGTTPCEDVVAANLDELALGFATNQVDQNYTLKFIDVEGRTLKLYDKVTGTVTTIANNGTYNFSVDASLVGRHQINDRFAINLTVAPALCFRNNILEINGHAGEALIIKDAATDTEIVNIPALGLFYTNDLSDKSGRLVVTLNSVDYQIDVNPIVTDL
jgi:hypothetical protein